MAATLAHVDVREDGGTVAGDPSRKLGEEASGFKGMIDSWWWPRGCGKRTSIGAQQTTMTLQFVHLHLKQIAMPQLSWWM